MDETAAASEFLFEKFNQPEIFSEYGMTELFSQGLYENEWLF